jgi:hypothetical protein
MPSVGYVFKRITAVVSEDGDFGFPLKYCYSIKKSSFDSIQNLSKTYTLSFPAQKGGETCCTSATENSLEKINCLFE